MQKPTFRKIKIGLAIAVTAYLLIGAALYFLQDKFLFHPQSLSPDHRFNISVPHKEILLPVNNNKILSIVQFTVPDSLCKGVVLYFHGNKKNIERYIPFASNFIRNHYEVWMMDYPGFGKSTGKRSEKIIKDDASLFYQMARSRFPKDSIILYGKSFGTGVAAWLASVKDCKSLVLETPYYSIEALMHHYTWIYPVSWLSKYHFPTYQYLEKIEAPLTIFHGTDDGVIPYDQAVKLSKINERVKLITVERGTHNNLNSFAFFHQQLDSLLQAP